MRRGNGSGNISDWKGGSRFGLRKTGFGGVYGLQVDYAAGAVGHRYIDQCITGNKRV